MAPTLIASYEVDSGGDNTNTLTTTAFTPSNGEIIVVKGITWSTGQTLNTPTGGSQTYTQRAVADFGGFSGYAAIWTAVVAGSPGSMTVSVAPAVTSWHHIVVERWGSAQLAATPASGTGWYNGTAGTPSVNITTAAANSVVTWCSEDSQSISPTGRAYLLSGTEDGIFDGSGGANGVMYFAYASVGAAGTYAMGMSAPTGQKWNLAGIEIQAAASSTLSQGSTATARHPGAGPSNLRFLQSRRSNDYFSAWLTDTGTVVDALTVAASFTIDDPASGSDALTVTAAVPLADTASAVDALTVQDVTVGAAAPSPWHPGRGPTTARFYQTPRSTDVSLSTPVFLADTGTGSDALTVTAAVPLADTAAGDDQVTVAAAVPLTDTASGTDSLSVAAAVPLTDAASGVDAVTVAATVPLTDAATATDTIAVTAAVPLADAAAAVDALTVLDVTVGAAVGTTSRPWHPGRGPTNARFYQTPRSTGRVLVMAGQISGSAIGLGGMEEAGAVSATESASSALSAGIQ